MYFRFTAQSKFGYGSTLVLADITEDNAIPGLTSDALTATQAALVVEQLARLYARFWKRLLIKNIVGWVALYFGWKTA